MAKILVLSTVHTLSDTRIFFKEIHSLNKKYSNISFVVSSEKREVFNKDGINIIPLPIPKSKFERIKNQKIAWKIIKKQNPDIVHFHDPELIFLGYLIKKKLKIKVIFDIHENVSASFKDSLWIPSFIKPYLPKIYTKVEQFLIKDYDALIIAESSYKEIYGAKATEILNYPILSSEINREINFDGRINLVYIGGIWERRGAFLILELLMYLIDKKHDVFLYLIGPFVPPELEKRVEIFLEENNINQFVKKFGSMDIKSAYQILEKSHLGLSLMEDIGNYRNSLSTKIFEYMVHSIPYVVSNFEIYDDYTLNEKTGITVDYRNKNEVFQKVEGLINNRKLMREFGINGRNAVYNKWNWNTQEKKLFSIYDNILIRQV